MSEEHLPFGPATAIGRVEPDLAPPPTHVEPLPRPRSPDEESKPFTAPTLRYPEWLVAYA